MRTRFLSLFIIVGVLGATEVILGKKNEAIADLTACLEHTSDKEDWWQKGTKAVCRMNRAQLYEEVTKAAKVN